MFNPLSYIHLDNQGSLRKHLLLYVYHWMQSYVYDSISLFVCCPYWLAALCLLSILASSRGRLNWIESNWIELNWIELNWIELNWIELSWVELNWIEMDWNGLKWIELNWIELNWIGSGDGTIIIYFIVKVSLDQNKKFNEIFSEEMGRNGMQSYGSVNQLIVKLSSLP